MIIDIADTDDHVVVRLKVAEGKVSLEGEFPGGLTESDLSQLGFIYYEMDPRGEMVARVQDVPVEHSLRYLRALLDALPPGYHIAQVQSENIRREREQKRARFEQELSWLQQQKDEEF